jgi:hypothetical protein
MATTVKNTLNKVGDLIEDILGTNTSAYSNNAIGNKAGQTCLEKVGIEARAEHIMRNEYRKNDIEYTRALVLAEYAVQNEFKISSSDEPVVRNRGGLETLAEQYARRDSQWKSENEAWKKQKQEDDIYLQTHSKEELKKKKLEEKYASKENKINKQLEDLNKKKEKLAEEKNKLGLS